MNAGVALAEKEERTRDKEVQKAILGHDPEKWIKSNVEIRDEEQEGQEFEKIKVPNVVKGNAT